MSNDGRNRYDSELDVPDFMKSSAVPTSYGTSASIKYNNYDTSYKELDDDFKRARRNSVDSKPVKARKSKKHINKGRLIGSALLIASIAAGIKFGGPELMNWYDEIDTKGEYLSPYYEVIRENTHRTEDFQNYFYDTSSIANTFEDMMENGADDTTIAYVISTDLQKDYEQDEAETLFQSLFGEDRDTWAQEHGYSGIDDPAFFSETEDRIFRQAKADEYERNNITAQAELDSMFNGESVRNDSDEKGMGGK